MVLGIGIEQPPNHALVLRVVFLCLALEELDAALAQRDRDLDSFVSKNQVFRMRKKIRNDLEVSEDEWDILYRLRLQVERDVLVWLVDGGPSAGAVLQMRVLGNDSPNCSFNYTSPPAVNTSPTFSLLTTNGC